MAIRTDRPLTLDCSTKTGWCYRDEQGIVYSGVKRFEREGDLRPLRYFDFALWLRNTIDRFKPTVIIHECPHFRGYDPTLLLCGLVTRAEELACLKDIPFLGIHSGTIKKQVAGHGGASKDEMIAATRAVWPDWQPETDDEADARAMLLVWDILNKPDSPLSVVRAKIKPKKEPKKAKKAKGAKGGEG